MKSTNNLFGKLFLYSSPKKREEKQAPKKLEKCYFKNPNVPNSCADKYYLEDVCFKDDNSYRDDTIAIIFYKLKEDFYNIRKFSICEDHQYQFFKKIFNIINQYLLEYTLYSRTLKPHEEFLNSLRENILNNRKLFFGLDTDEEKEQKMINNMAIVISQIFDNIGNYDKFAKLFVIHARDYQRIDYGTFDIKASGSKKKTKRLLDKQKYKNNETKETKRKKTTTKETKRKKTTKEAKKKTKK